MVDISNNKTDKFKLLTGLTFEQLYKAYNNKLIHYTWNLCHDEALSQDLATESWMKAMKSIDSYDPSNSKFNTWLYTIARNLFLNEIRKNPVGKNISIDKETDDGLKVKDILHDNDTSSYDQDIIIKKAEIIKKRIYELPEKYSAVLIRNHIEGLQYDEIAEDLNLNLSTVKSQIKKGREKLIELIQNDFFEIENPNFELVPSEFKNNKVLKTTTLIESIIPEITEPAKSEPVIKIEKVIDPAILRRNEISKMYKRKKAAEKEGIPYEEYITRFDNAKNITTNLSDDAILRRNEISKIHKRKKAAEKAGIPYEEYIKKFDKNNKSSELTAEAIEKRNLYSRTYKMQKAALKKGKEVDGIDANWTVEMYLEYKKKKKSI